MIGAICFAQSHKATKKSCLPRSGLTPFTLRQGAAMMKERPCGRAPPSSCLCVFARNKKSNRLLFERSFPCGQLRLGETSLPTPTPPLSQDQNPPALTPPSPPCHIRPSSL